MTYLEKYKEEHPNVNASFYTLGCPSKYGYPSREKEGCNGTCEECWNREMPNTEVEKNMKYKVGVVVRTTKDRDINGCKLFPIGTVGVITGIDKKDCCPYIVQALNDYWNYSEDMLEPFKSYEDGLNDAWELAKKITKMDYHDFFKAFNMKIKASAIKELTPQEALAKLKAYEDGKIEVGDIVKSVYTERKGIVTRISEKEIQLLFKDGSGGNTKFLISEFKKTGEHIDLETIFKQLGE